MTAQVVVDSSALVALLLDAGDDGRWVSGALQASDIAAPGLVGFETANIIRRHELAGLISSDQAVQGHTDLLALAIEHWPYELLAARSWELRLNLPAYDASYVALAELLGAPLITLDRRIAGAPGIRCEVAVPS